MKSLLFAPGNHARRVEKALGLAAGGVILDLEDAVAVSEKVATRAIVTEAFRRPRSGALYVRVNALTTDWCHGDITAVVQPGLDGLILPKVEYAHELRVAD
jgi:citrate lyase subunit beta/citryl-CoA lyase